MALAIGGALFSGKIGNKVYNKNGTVRNYVVPTNPQTDSQQANRNVFQAISAAFKGLSAAEQESWQVGRYNFPTVNRIGETIILAAHVLFNSLNKNLRSIGQDPITTCPASVEVPLIGETAIAIDKSDGTMLVDSLLATIPTGFSMRVYATPLMNGGVKGISANRSRLIAILEETDAFDTADLASLWITYYGVAATEWGVKQQITFSFDLVSTDSGQSGSLVTARGKVVA